MSADMPHKMFRTKGQPSAIRMSVSRLGTTPSARRLARGRDHHCATSLVGACILCGIRPLSVGIFSSSVGPAAFTVATVLCTAATGAGGPVDLKRSGSWATVESRECSSACVTAPSAANDSTTESRGEPGAFTECRGEPGAFTECRGEPGAFTECRGEPGAFLKTGFRMKGVAGATGSPDLGFGFGAAGGT